MEQNSPPQEALVDDSTYRLVMTRRVRAGRSVRAEGHADSVQRVPARGRHATGTGAVLDPAGRLASEGQVCPSCGDEMPDDALCDSAARADRVPARESRDGSIVFSMPKADRVTGWGQPRSDPRRHVALLRDDARHLERTAGPSRSSSATR